MAVPAQPHGTRGRILIADDEEAARRSLGQILTEDGFDVRLAANGDEALRILAAEAPDVLVTDLRMPGMDGHELIGRVSKAYPNIAVVIMTAHGTIRSAVQALRSGAEDYLTKPIDVEEMEHLLDRILKSRRLVAETQLLRERLDEKYRFENIIGSSPQMLDVFRLIEQVAPTQASILITGESGTGKEVVAQAIHQHSRRRDAPFVKVACAALPETLLESELFGHERGAFTGAVARRSGRFEMAAGGTIFLDEIGDVPAGMQVKLLRFLQERQFERLGGNQTLTVDVRILTATHRNLLQMVSAGTFREDLYYRLNVIEIHVPPLRERAQDIPLLVDHFIKKSARENGKSVEWVTNETMSALVAAPWPGNVRELEHAIERAVILCRSTTLDLSLFPGLAVPEPGEEARTATAAPSLPPVGRTLAEIERETILRTLEAVNGSTVRAAEILGISPRKIQYKIKEYRARGAVIRLVHDEDAQDQEAESGEPGPEVE